MRACPCPSWGKAGPGFVQPSSHISEWPLLNSFTAKFLLIQPNFAMSFFTFYFIDATGLPGPVPHNRTPGQYTPLTFSHRPWGCLWVCVGVPNGRVGDEANMCWCAKWVCGNMPRGCVGRAKWVCAGSWPRANCLCLLVENCQEAVEFGSRWHVTGKSFHWMWVHRLNYL